VAIFLDPNSRFSSIYAPLATLVKGIGKVFLSAGTKVAKRVKAVINGFIEYSKAQPIDSWEFFYICVDDEYMEDRDYWEDIVWGVLNKADRNNQMIWSQFTDHSRLDLLKIWGFSDVEVGWIVDNKVPIWSATRQPQRRNSKKVRLSGQPLQ